MALLNNADEPDLYVKSSEVIAKRAEVEQQIAMLKQNLNSAFPAEPGPEDEAIRRERNLNEKFAIWVKQSEESAAVWTSIRPKN
jgi:hypothetical protein